MKITDIQGLGIEQVQAGQAGAVAPKEDRHPVAASGGGDVIQLSDTARLMQKAAEAIAATEEVRPEKVMALRDAVQQGAYEVDPQKVANSIIVNLLQER